MFNKLIRQVLRLGLNLGWACIQYPMFYRIDIESVACCPKLFFFHCSFESGISLLASNLTHKSRPLVAFFIIAFSVLKWPFRPCNGLRTAVAFEAAKAHILEASVASSPAFQRGNCRRSSDENGRQLRLDSKLLVGPL